LAGSSVEGVRASPVSLTARSILLDDPSDKPDYREAAWQISSKNAWIIGVLDVALVLQLVQSSALFAGLDRQKRRAKVGLRHERMLN